MMWQLMWRNVRTAALNVTLNFLVIYSFFFSSFKLKRFTQNSKTELKRLWVGLYSGTK